MKNIIAVLFTLIELKSAECNVGCKYLSYSKGYYEDGSCICLVYRKYEDITEKEIISLPKKIPTNKVGRDVSIFNADY